MIGLEWTKTTRIPPYPHPWRQPMGRLPGETKDVLPPRYVYHYRAITVANMCRRHGIDLLAGGIICLTFE